MKRIDELFRPLILILSLIVFVWYALTTRYEYYVVPGNPNGNNNTSTNRVNMHRNQDAYLPYVVQVDVWTNKMIRAEELRRKSLSRPSASTGLREADPDKSSRNSVRPDYGSFGPDNKEQERDPEVTAYYSGLYDPDAEIPSYDPKQVARDYAIFDSVRRATKQEQAQESNP